MIARLEIGTRLGMGCISKLPINTADWPGYEMKRHHNGKSFQSRVQTCFHYVLGPEKTNATKGSSTNILELLASFRISDHPPLDYQMCNKELTIDKAPISQTKKKRRLHQLVEGMYKVDNGSGVIQFVCNNCGKIFPTEQVCHNI